MARVKKHAAYCGTRNIYADMETSAKSLIASSDVDVVHFFCEDAEWPHELPSMVQVHDVHEQTFFPRNGPNMKSGYTYMAMMRATLSKLLPRVSKVLSLDADLVCVQTVSEIWELPLDDCYFSAAHEWHRTRDGDVYTNAGVTLYNLRAMRDGKTDELIEALNTNVFPWLDQDVQNYRCQGHIQEMPSCYNSNWWTDKNAPGAKIVHFAGVQRDRWINDPRVVRWRETPWEDVLWLHERHVMNR